MPDVDVLLRPEARFFYHEVATPVERQTIDSIIAVICANPGVDEAIRFSTARGETLYNDATFWILYRALNSWTIEILGIGTVADHG